MSHSHSHLRVLLSLHTDTGAPFHENCVIADREETILHFEIYDTLMKERIWIYRLASEIVFSLFIQTLALRCTTSALHLELYQRDAADEMRSPWIFLFDVVSKSFQELVTVLKNLESEVQPVNGLGFHSSATKAMFHFRTRTIETVKVTVNGGSGVQDGGNVVCFQGSTSRDWIRIFTRSASALDVDTQD